MSYWRIVYDHLPIQLLSGHSSSFSCIPQFLVLMMLCRVLWIFWGPHSVRLHSSPSTFSHSPQWHESIEYIIWVWWNKKLYIWWNSRYYPGAYIQYIIENFEEGQEVFKKKQDQFFLDILGRNFTRCRRCRHREKKNSQNILWLLFYVYN